MWINRVCEIQTPLHILCIIPNKWVKLIYPRVSTSTYIYPRVIPLWIEELILNAFHKCIFQNDIKKVAHGFNLLPKARFQKVIFSLLHQNQKQRNQIQFRLLRSASFLSRRPTCTVSITVRNYQVGYKHLLSRALSPIIQSQGLNYKTQLKQLHLSF